MFDINSVVLGKLLSEKGLYESCYFRGNSKNFAFWLKHNLLQFNNASEVRIENTFILYNLKTKSTKVAKEYQDIPVAQYRKHLEQNSSWTQFAFSFNSSSEFKINKDNLVGCIHNSKNNVSWNFNLANSGISYLHLNPKSLYQKGFPKKKILTSDLDIKFSGKIVWDDLIIEDEFIGMNGHNWGTEHAHKYAYANCNQFDTEDFVYFDGFSAKIKIAGIFKSPFLSCASLLVNGQWFHFNHILDSYKHTVKALEKEKWHVTYFNESSEMEVSINGNDQTWITLDYDHPSRKISKVHNTKTASGKIILRDRKTKIVIKEYQSNWFELESLIP